MEAKLLEIPYIGDVYGQCAVLPSESYIARNVKYVESLFPPEDGKSLVETIGAKVTDARAAGVLKTYNVSIRPYTYWEKTEATRKASSMVGLEMTVDPGKMNQELILAATDVTKDELKKLANPIVQAIWDEVAFLSEPDPNRLLFLSIAPTSGDSAEAKTESESSAS